MKQFFKFGIILLLMMSAFPSFGEGLYNPGRVQVINMGGSAIITGAYNVRHNPDVTQGYISVSYTPGSSISLSAADSATGQAMGCNIAATDTIYPNTEKLMALLGNGAQIWAQLNTSNGKCTNFGVSVASKYLD